MYLSSLFNYYKIGRFVFALALLISFQIAGFPYAIPRLMFILAIYSFISLIRFIIASEKIIYFDFLLDIVFISAMVYISLGLHSYLTLLYLFPIFFSSVLIKTKKIVLFPITAAMLYGAIYYMGGIFMEKDSLLNLSLHFLSFSLISLAGDNLKERMETQEKHIKRLEEERIKMKGYERLYRVSADIAHELRNPLASISAAVQFLEEGKTDREFIDMLGTETRRLTKLVNDFLMFSRPSDAPKEDMDLTEVIKSLLASQNTDKKIEMTSSESAAITANRTFMEVALNNIIKNALEAAKSLIKIRLNTKHTGIAIEVEDDGIGISEDMRDKIFEPFVTTKADGTGLGLAIAYRIITSAGGDILVDRSVLGGAKFTILFRNQPPDQNIL